MSAPKTITLPSGEIVTRDDLKDGCYAYIPSVRTPYDYVPSLAPGVVFCILFFLSFAGHTVQFGLKRRWTSFVFALGALTEMVGWGGRTWSSQCPYNSTAFIIQITTLIIGPTFLGAGLYIILGGLINRLGRQSSILGPKMYAIIFLSCDILAFVIQAIGGGMAAAASNTVGGDTTKGTNTMIAGIVFQMAAMVVFTFFVLDFMRRVFLKTATLGFTKLGNSPSQGLPKQYTLLLAAVLVALTMIFVRSVYRTIELAQGWSGYLLTHEEFFIGLDASLMVVAAAVFNFLDPVFLLWGEGDRGLGLSEEEVELQPGAGVAWRSS